MRWIDDERFGQVAPKLRMGSGWQNLRLSPEEGFILSRVDGSSSIEEICLVAGLPRTQILETLEKLHGAGVLEVSGAPTIGAQTSGTPGPQAPEEGQQASTEATLANPVPEDAAGSGSSTVIPGFEPDPNCELSPERQQTIHELYYRLDELDFYELLGLSMGCDARDVQRAYRKISLKYHPDRFFNKQLGGVKARLEAIFRHVSNVVEYLSDDDQRSSYEADLATTPVHASSAPGEDTALAAAGAGAAANGADDAIASTPRAPAPGSPSTSNGDPPAEGQPAEEEPRSLTREQRLRRLGGILGMSSQELRAVARNRKTGAHERPAAPLPELSPERQKRIRSVTRSGLKATLGPMLQRKQKAKTHYDEGIKAMQAGNWTSAASNLKLALTFDPKNQEYRDKEATASVKAREVSAVSYAKRASVEDSVGRYDEAARLYAMAADRHATVEHLTRASKALIRIGELKRGVEYAIKARDLNPNSVTARVALGSAYLTADMPKSARREVDFALKLDADNQAAKALLKEIRKAD